MQSSGPKKWRRLGEVAHLLGVPERWLRREVCAGRIPHLRVGRRVMANVEQVAGELRARANDRDRNTGGYE